MNKTLKVILILGVLGLIGLVGGVVAFAQSEAPAAAAPALARVQVRAQEQVQVQEPAPTPVTPAGNGYGQRQGMGPGQGLVGVDQDEMHAALAGVLGMTVEELDEALAAGKTLVVLAQEQGVEITAVRDAMTAVRADALAQAVADGLLTTEEAAWMQERGGGPANRGNLGGGPGMGPGPHSGDASGLGFVDETEMHAAIAAALGINVAELEAAQAEGTPLVLIAQEAGIEITVVREAMASVRKDAIDQAVADGLLTPEQGEWLLSRPAYGSRAGSGAGPGNGMGNSGYGPGAGRGGPQLGQYGRTPDELTGVGSGHGRGYGQMNTP